MDESELYRELGLLTKDKGRREESIPYVSSLLSHESVKILCQGAIKATEKAALG